jgi:hypothetical protein
MFCGGGDGGDDTKVVRACFEKGIKCNKVMK